MEISVYGAGYVGLVTALCLAKMGHDVCCMDNNPERIKLLQEGKAPIYEHDLQLLLCQQIQQKKIFFTQSAEEAIHFSTLHFIALGTPSLQDGSADLIPIYDLIEHISQITTKSCSIVIKSTVPVGTGTLLQHAVNEALHNYAKNLSISIASNPEFLREGSAINDFLHADRIVIGGNDEVVALLKEVYRPLTDTGLPLIAMNQSSAELTKYAANTLLACKISFINKISELAEQCFADIDHITQGIALDHRIGPYFLQAGVGYGGSCFSKDLRALIQISKNCGVDASLLEAIDGINQHQKKWVIKQLNQYFSKGLQGIRIGIWGLAFKPGTDDIRDASSLTILTDLSAAGADLVVYDPQAMPNAQQALKHCPRIEWVSDSDAVLANIDALVLITEWEEFLHYPLAKLKEKLASTPLFDGRNCYNLALMEQMQFNYYSVGRQAITHLVALETCS